MARETHSDQASHHQRERVAERRVCDPAGPLRPFPPARLAVSLVRQWLESHDSTRLTDEQTRQFAARCTEFFRAQALDSGSVVAAYQASASDIAANGQCAATEFESGIEDPSVRAAFAALTESLLDTYRICSGLERLRPPRQDDAPIACELWHDGANNPTLYTLTKWLTRVPRHALEAG